MQSTPRQHPLQSGWLQSTRNLHRRCCKSRGPPARASPDTGRETPRETSHSPRGPSPSAARRTPLSHSEPPPPATRPPRSAGSHLPSGWKAPASYARTVGCQDRIRPPPSLALSKASASAPTTWRRTRADCPAPIHIHRHSRAHPCRPSSPWPQCHSRARRAHRRPDCTSSPHESRSSGSAPRRRGC